MQFALSLSVLSEINRIWSPFIPFPYLQVFQRGAYYSVEVIPDTLAVISLNTMYFYDSNKGFPPPTSTNVSHFAQLSADVAIGNQMTPATSSLTGSRFN